MREHSVAAVTMVRDDIFFLRKWVSYYGDQFGRENLYVINHARESAVTEAAAGCNIIGIPEGDNRRFDIKRWRLLNGLLNGLNGYYDQVIVGDVDEFVVADPQHWPSLIDCLRANSLARVVTPFGLEVTHRPKIEPDPVDKAILGPRRHVQIASPYSKPCILSDFARISRGGHYAEHDKLTMPEGLYLFHMRYADRTIYEDTMNRRNKVVADTRAENPKDIMIGRHWFASQRNDRATFVGFGKRPIRDWDGFVAERAQLAATWRRRGDGDDAKTWQFDTLPQDALFIVPDRMFGLI